MSDESAVTIDCIRIGRGNKFNVVARTPGNGLVVSELKLAVAEERESFADKVCDGRPGISRDDVLEMLTKIAADEIGSDPGAAPRMSQASELVKLVRDIEGVELFHTPEDEAYITMPVGDHRETAKVTAKAFRAWLSFLFFRQNKKTPSAQAIQDAIGTISGHAKYEGEERAVHVRIAEYNGDIWLDLCDAKWRAVRVGRDGWHVVPSDQVPVKFVRRKGMEALPEPIRGGSVEELRHLLNMPDDDAWVLTVGWLVGALHPTGPYGVLSISGEHGSAKSTTSRIVRRTIDPNLADLRRPPRDERDAFISAGNSWISAYNNLSGVSANLSDAFCALATDGGFATRTLYADDDESIFSARRPVILNGIEPPASRPDLVDRTISIVLKTIGEDARREERDIFAEFDRIHARVLGGLLDAVVSALMNRDKVKLKRLPRMADLSIWVTAAEPGLGWKDGRFVEAYFRNRSEANTDVVEGSSLSVAIMALLSKGPFQGTMQDLLSTLTEGFAGKQVPKDWPLTHQKLRVDLLRLAPNLRSAGYRIDFPDRRTGHAKRRVLFLEYERTSMAATAASDADAQTEAASTPSAEEWETVDQARAAIAADAAKPIPTQSSIATAEVAP